jgi:RND family efflux transporter MFP subunit
MTAPFDGVIAQRFVEAGQTLPAKTPVVRFQDAEELEIVIDVPEAVMAADIRTADVLQMTAEFNGVPGVDFPVELREIAQVADPATQTFQVRVAMRAPEGATVLPGMTAAVTVRYRRSSLLNDATFVPVSAVLTRDSGEQIAWIVGDDGAVQSRSVTVGSIVGSTLEIVEGLSPGDRIAVAGVTRLRDGMQVRDLGDALGGGAR